MEDYAIKRLNEGEWGITAQSERAKKRNPGPGTMIAFKGLDDDMYDYIGGGGRASLSQARN